LQDGPTASPRPVSRYALDAPLLDKIADFRKYAFTQFHAQQLCTRRCEQILLKSLNHRVRQIRLSMQHPKYRGAVSGKLVITWEAACRADRQGEGDSAGY
jgi:hypothetical protein